MRAVWLLLLVSVLITHADLLEDFKNGAWESGPYVLDPQPTERAFHTALGLSIGGDSTLFVFGGQLFNGVANDAWLHNQGEILWRNATSKLGPNPPPRCNHASAALSGDSFVVFGGSKTTCSAGVASQAFYSDLWFGQITNSSVVWTELPSDNQPALASSSLVLLNDYIVRFGGVNIIGNVTGDVMIYTRNHTWVRPFIPTVGAVPQARWGHAATVASSSMFLFGGCAADGSLLNDFWQLQYAETDLDDVVHMRWTQQTLTTVPTARVQMAMFGVASVLTMMCGYSDQQQPLSDMWLIDALTGASYQALSAPTARAGAVASGVVCLDCGQSPVMLALTGGIPLTTAVSMFAPDRAETLLNSYLWDMLPLAIVALALVPVLVFVLRRRCIRSNQSRQGGAYRKLSPTPAVVAADVMEQGA